MLAKRAERIEKQAKGTAVYGVIPWDIVLPSLLQLLGNLCKPKNPAPVNPTPSPTPAQTAAWNDAWALKSAAVESWDGSTYSPKTINKTTAQIRKANRRDGRPVSKADGQQAAILALDDARQSSMADMYHDVLEARHAS